MITLAAIAEACGPGFGVQRIGGNVYGVTDYAVMITINGGQREVEEGSAELCITDSWSGADLFTDEVFVAGEVPVILASL